MAFRIFQDMRGVQATYRITPATTTVTTSEVTVNADVIYVANAAALPEPDFAINIWGVVTIDAERIMYRYRDINNNTISGLMRGTAGTAVTAHADGATVYNIGRNNLLPAEYQNYIVSNITYPLVSGVNLGDGTTTVFTADDINLLLEDSTIRDESLEVYVGGIRVVNHPVGLVLGETYTISELGNTDWAAVGVVGTPTVGVEFQAADPTVQAGNFVIGKEYVIISQGNPATPTNFTLIGAANNLPGTSFVATNVGTGSGTAWAEGTGLLNYTIINDNPATVEFVYAPANGSEVTMLVRRGVTWYAQGAGTASNGNPLQITETPAARFLRGQ
jgi:hypothetical protein